jgi:hypothetical protein
LSVKQINPGKKSNLNNVKYLSIKYATRDINVNKITWPVINLANKMLNDGWFDDKNKQWNKHFTRMEKAADRIADKIKNKNCNAHAKIFDDSDERIKQDRQYKLWKLQWEYDNKPCRVYVNYRDDITKLLASLSGYLNKNIHPGVAVELLVEAYHRYYSLDNIRKCPECHRKVLQTSGRGRKSIYCSHACKIKAYRKRKRENVYLNKVS